ncbi:MAG: GYD domain-containing protein [Thermomicrobiales bacterium]
MPMYLSLVNWTDQGVKDLKQSPRRAQAFKQLATEMGCTVHGIFFTMGRYDIATRIEAPDDETISALALKLGQLGNVRTETMRAYTEEEFAKIMQKVTG